MVRKCFRLMEEIHSDETSEMQDIIPENRKVDIDMMSGSWKERS